MIDFKYHLVSLISVFMALAIGIVLGAGPLQDSLGQTLSDQVSSLRSEKENLQRTVRDQEQSIGADDRYLQTFQPAILAGRLEGERVLVVRLGDASGDTAKALVQAVQSAGGTVSGTVTLTSAWADPDQVSARADAARAIADAVGELPSTDTDAYLRDKLATLLLTTAADRNGGTADRSDEVLKALTNARLLGYEGTPTQGASLVLVVSGSTVVPANETEDSRTERTRGYAAWVSVLTALREHGRGAVLAGPRRTATTTTPVAALRSDNEAAQRISGVDDVDHPMGVTTAVLALREQADGQAGQYGTAGDAADLLPDAVVREAAPSSAPS